VGEKDALLHVPSAGLTLYAPAPRSNSSSEVVEVTAEAPMVDTSSAQVTHTFSGQELHPSASGGNGPGVIGGPIGRLEAKQKAEWDTTLKLVQPKFTADLLAFYQCASIGATPDGKPCTPPASKVVKVQVELASTSPIIAQKLARAGFSVESGKGTLQLTGSILTYRLKQLAQIAEVKSVSLNQ
jgi:hypothetical protein